MYNLTHNFEETQPLTIVCTIINLLAATENALDRDNFMDPEEAMSFGLIDNITRASPDPAPSEEK